MNVSKVQNWRLVVLVVVAIVTLLTVTNGFSLYEARKAYSEVDLVVDSAMKSSDLVHQKSRNWKPISLPPLPPANRWSALLAKGLPGSGSRTTLPPSGNR